MCCCHTNSRRTGVFDGILNPADHFKHSVFSISTLTFCVHNCLKRYWVMYPHNVFLTSCLLDFQNTGKQRIPLSGLLILGIVSVIDQRWLHWIDCLIDQFIDSIVSWIDDWSIELFGPSFYRQFFTFLSRTKISVQIPASVGNHGNQATGLYDEKVALLPPCVRQRRGRLLCSFRR